MVTHSLRLDFACKHSSMRLVVTKGYVCMIIESETPASTRRFLLSVCLVAGIAKAVPLGTAKLTQACVWFRPKFLRR